MTSITKFGGSTAALRQRDNFLHSFDDLFDRMMGSTFGDWTKDLEISAAKGSYPKVDVIRTDNAVKIVAELAGFTKEDISIDIDTVDDYSKNSVLTISGSSAKDTTTDKSAVYVVKELKRSRFSRAFILSPEVNTSSIKASFDNGLLTISMDLNEVKTHKRKQVLID